MKKNTIIKKSCIAVFVLICVHSWLLSTTITIKQDGSGDFTTIQAGIEASSDADTILVHPGTYYENLDFLSKSITLGSLRMTTGDEQYIEQTVIDGNYSGSCLYLESVQSAVIDGVTIQHGSGDIINPLSFYYGGGVLIEYSSITLKYCIIEDNTASNGAGLAAYNTQLQLSKTKIRYNHATRYGGGIGIGVNSTVNFDEIDLCDVYLNTAQQANDFFISGCDNLNIILDTFTVDSPDTHTIKMIQGENYSFSCQQAAVETVAADLHVAPWGDNANSGISPAEPLQSIALALTKIEADSLNPRTIHLADGTYSPSLNNQSFPLNLKSYVSLAGESETDTILDAEQLTGFMGAMDKEKNVGLKNFTCQNGYFPYSGVFIWFYDNESATLENITIKDCTSSEGRVSALATGGPVRIKNLHVENIQGHYVVYIYPVDSVCEDITITHAIPNAGDSSGGALLVSSNSEITGEPTVIKNILINDCINNENEWFTSASVLVSQYAEAFIINATIADNFQMYSCGAAITVQNAELTLINSILYDNSPRQLCIDGNQQNVPSILTVQNCLVEGGESAVTTLFPYTLNWMDGNIDTDPLFVDGENDFRLQSYSPCIDAGTMDLPAGIELPEFDLAGNPRISGDSIDMGAYEYQDSTAVEPPLPKPPVRTSISSYPNPFRPSASRSGGTTIMLELVEEGPITVDIYNIKGQKVLNLMDSTTCPGTYKFSWNGRDAENRQVASGQYFVKVVQQGQTTASKMVMLK
jgi:hypothetical protein